MAQEAIVRRAVLRDLNGEALSRRLLLHRDQREQLAICAEIQRPPGRRWPALHVRENRHRKNSVHARGFSHRPAKGIYDPCKIGDPFAAPQDVKLLIQPGGSAASFHICPERENLVEQHFIILRKRVPHHDPVEDAKAAEEEQRSGEREIPNKLRRDRARFSRF